MFIISTDAPLDEVRGISDSQPDELSGQSYAHFLATDSLLGDPQTIIAIATLAGHTLLFARSICLALIRRNRHVYIKYGEIELSAESAADMEKIISKLGSLVPETSAEGPDAQEPRDQESPTIPELATPSATINSDVKPAKSETN